MRTVAELMSLAGRTAIVTGAAGHIGSVVASALAELGASVALVDRNMEMLQARANEVGHATEGKVSVHPVDLLDEGSVRALPQRVVEEHGGINILVNCAAFVGDSKLEGWSVPFEQQGAHAWRLALEVNLTAAFLLVQASLPFMRNAKNGSVINVSSIYGSLGPDWSFYEGTQMANPAAYGASKGGLEQLTRWLATTLAPDVRVNCLSPGGVARQQPASFVERYVTRTPMGRMACEEDFKGTIAYLASDLSAYVTGQNIMVDGGYSVW